MAGAAVPRDAAVPPPELAGADVHATASGTVASAAASATAGAERSGRDHGRAQGFRCATNPENTLSPGGRRRSGPAQGPLRASSGGRGILEYADGRVFAWAFGMAATDPADEISELS